ncbi:MAG: hypothetical protein KGL43_08595 [Burkholderiales bacterium]|nr:hypothetical protein [Burkholderiales bacterium]MDE2394301.1 hypothetical protein [Burkholderiales bacterium]MDE2453639.1 hypothetical protein [Burkholderiales bacterium]
MSFGHSNARGFGLHSVGAQISRFVHFVVDSFEKFEFSSARSELNMSPQAVLAWANRIQDSDPDLASDLRAAVFRGQN